METKTGQMVRQVSFQLALDRFNKAVFDAQEQALENGVHVCQIGKAVFYCPPDDRYGHRLYEFLAETFAPKWGWNPHSSGPICKQFGSVKARVAFGQHADVLVGLCFDKHGFPALEKTSFRQGFAMQWWVESAFLPQGN